MEAIPTDLIRALHAEKEVIFSPNWLPSSPLLITVTDDKYLRTLKAHLDQVTLCGNAI